MKKICILCASPHKEGNTHQLADCFAKEARSLGSTTQCFYLYDMDLRPCLACRACQLKHDGFHCVQKDDMQQIFDALIACDLIVLASPIHSWYCTPPMKAVLDRMVYGMNKYYGAEKGPALWAGRELAVITSCGYRPERGADLWEEGVRRYCKHSQLHYRGMLAERHLGYDTVFMDAEKMHHATAFAQMLCAAQMLSD